MAQAEKKHATGCVMHTAAAALNPGDVVTRTNGIGIYNGKKAAASGDEVTLETAGVFTMTAKNIDTWPDGALLYWDDTNNELTDTASGNTLAGQAVGAKAGTGTSADCDINFGCFDGVDT